MKIRNYKIFSFKSIKNISLFYKKLQGMGNYCSEDYGKSNGLIAKKRKTLNNKMTRLIYEAKLSQEMNHRISLHEQNFTPKYLQIKSLIGKGGQGSVFLTEMCQSPITGIASHVPLAMKRIEKKKLTTTELKDSIHLENHIMTEFKSPFLSKLRFSFEDHFYLYFFMDVAQGGDLFSYVDNSSKSFEFDKLGEEAIKFLFVGIILGLQSLHEKKIIYRDLKAENILIGQDGYPILSDFGLSVKEQKVDPEKVRGTLLYFAPQLTTEDRYDHSIDLWSLGILLYFVFFRCYPFEVDDVLHREFPKICKKKENCHKLKSHYASESAKNLINLLLQVNPKNRLGYDDFLHLKSHSFFQGINWKSYEQKKYLSPLKHMIKLYPIEAETDLKQQSVKSDGNDEGSSHNILNILEESGFKREKFTKSTTTRESDGSE